MYDEEGLEDDEPEVAVAKSVSKPPPRVETNKDILDFPDGSDECYWCGKVMKKENMNKQKSHNSIIFICGDCSPR